MVSEVRCPMCSKPNRANAEECEFCGARLKPLDIGSPEEGEQEAADWLDRIRDQAAPPDAEQESGAEPKEPEEDWLGRLRQVSEEPESEGEEPPQPEAPAPAPEPEIDQPVSEPEAAQTEPEAEELAPAEEDEAPEWLARIRRREEEQLGFGEEEPEEAETEWLDKLRSATPDEPEFEAPIESPELEPEPSEEDSEVEDLSWLEDLQVDAAPQTPEREPEPQPEPEPEPEPAEMEEPVEEPPAEEAEGDLPHVPALVGDESEPAAPGFDLPEWLGDADVVQELGEEEDEDQKPDQDLAPATLPAWLEAMRPVETFQSVVEIEPEEDQAVESVGPLAGLRGVLMAEPVVAMPRTSQGGSMQLSVSERQFAQAELLQRMVREEEREEPAKVRRGPRLAIIRWAITAVLFIATAMPSVLGFPTFRLPILEPRELGALYELVNSLPSSEPALFVFDYEPGYSGEMEAVTGPLLEQVTSRGIPVVSMSTKPTGSPIAVRLIDRYASRHAYENGVDLIHLGYLSGGPTGVQLFAVAPREAILRGFSLPLGLAQTAWQSPVLSEVGDLSDFGMIVVVTSGTESARVWAEQAKQRMGSTPLVMVLSAGAEPLVRPYFEAETPQVNGILTGLPAATAYERRNALPADAQGSWDSFGAGMFAAELVLMVGIAYGAARWYLRRRE